MESSQKHMQEILCALLIFLSSNTSLMLMQGQLLCLPEQGKAESLIQDDKDDKYFQV